MFPSRQSFHLFLPVCCRDLEYPQGPSASCHVSFQEDLPLLPAGLCSGQEERREEADAKAWLCQKETNTKQQLPTLPEQLSNRPPWQAFFCTDPRFHFYCSNLSVHTILIDFLFRKFILKISDLLMMDCEESWAPKNWCFWTVVLEKTLESPLDSKEIQPVHPKGDQSWVFIGRTDAEAETSILATSCKELTHWKRLWCLEGLGQEEKGMTEDEMAGWHHWLNGHEFEWIPGAGDGQGGLVCYDSWCCKELDMTEVLNWTELMADSCWSLIENIKIL